MRAIHWAIIMAALILTCLWAMFSLSAKAAECVAYDAVVAGIEAKGIHPFFIATDKLPKTVEDLEAITGDTYGAASRGFILETDTLLIFGLEIQGCIIDPIKLVKPKPDASV